MLEQICRTCLATCGELVPIFSNDYYVHDLPNKLLNTTKIEILKDDDLPKMMCKKCIFLVDSLYCFKDQCEMAEIKLKKTLKETLDNNESILLINTSAFDERSCDSYILDDHSGDLTSSEEEYHIEYASEEARLEVENARRQSRNTKRESNKYSSSKVTSVDITPAESKNNYKNNSMSSKCDTTELDEDNVISDNDCNMLLYTTQGLRSYTNNISNKDDNYNSSNSTEKINFFKNEKRDKFNLKKKIKRKLKISNNFNQLSKVPKKVIFKENDYNNENIQFIELSENETVKNSEPIQLKLDEELSTVTNFSINQHDSEVDFLNHKLLNNDNHISNNLSNTLTIQEQYDKLSTDSNTKKVLEIRIQNLIKRIVLNYPEVCTICSQYFETYLDVLKHKVETHLNFEENDIFCPICQEKFFYNNNLVEHLHKHKDIYSFVCLLCYDNFHTDDTLRDHLFSHVDLWDLRCYICSKKFIQIQTLLSHLDQHITKKQLLCTLCSYNCNSKDELQNHLHQEHRTYSLPNKTICKTCGMDVSENEIKEHMKIHINYPCPYCERSYSTKMILRDHVRTHLGKQPFSCLVCNKTFASQDERTHHMQEHMKPQPKKFRCRVCHEILLSRIAYGQHLKEKHWSAKQTSEILQELSESSVYEKVNEQLIKNNVTHSESEFIR